MARTSIAIMAGVAGASLAVVAAAGITAAVATSGGKSVAQIDISVSASLSEETGLQSDLPPDLPPDLPINSAGPAGSPAVDQRSTGHKLLPRDFNIRTRGKVFFITIDDGNDKTDAALKYVQRHKIPVTAFLTAAAVQGDWSYFRKITSYGGSVENHTMTHKSLIGDANLHYEICKTQHIYAKKFHNAPKLLRPPYGYGGYATAGAKRQALDTTARSCGIKHIVMWNAVAEGGKFTFVKGSLHRGDIVLFHFKQDLASELKQVIAMAKRHRLHPGSLTGYLH